jgi:hypothetical protein
LTEPAQNESSSIAVPNLNGVALETWQSADANTDKASITATDEDGIRETSIDESVVVEALAEGPSDSDQQMAWVENGKPAGSKAKQRDGKKDQLRTDRGHFQCDNQAWELKFALLKQFHQDNKHCIVPRNHPEIGDWASRQRRMYKLKQMSLERKKRLDELGFSWNRDSERWDEHFLELLEYKRAHGNCLVPRRFQSNLLLARWVEAQRNYYNNDRKKISQERIERLNNVGFAWSDNKKTEWDVRFQELVQYKEEHGDTLVPQRNDKTGALGNWVVAQRYHYKRKNKRLTQERIDKLNLIGFVWDASNRNCCAPGFKRKAKASGATFVSVMAINTHEWQITDHILTRVLFASTAKVSQNG